MSDEPISAVPREPPPGFRVLNWTRGFGPQVGPLYRKTTNGEAVTGLYVEERHANGMQNAHGGVLMTLADMSWGNVVSMERSSYWVTVRLICDFLSSVRIGEWIEAAGDLISEQDDLFVVQGRVWCGDQTLVSGTGIFKAVKPREPRPGEKAYSLGAAHG